MAATLETERKLRIITILSAIPGFAICLGGAVASSGVNIGMAIIPLVLGFVYGIYHLTHWGRELSKNLPILSDSIDAVLGIVSVIILIPFWAVETQRLYYHSNFVMLNTYGSAFLMINAGIHCFFASRRLCSYIILIPFRRGPCPHCEREARSSTAQRTRDGAQYSLLGDGPEEYRDSIDGATPEAPKEPKASSANVRGDEEDVMLAQV